MSITLSAAYSTSVIGASGFITETDASAALMAAQADAVAQTLTIVFRLGTATQSGGKTTAFLPGQQAPSVSITFTLGSINNWTSSNGQSGALTSAQTTAVAGIMTGILSAVRNPGESFAFAANIFGPGGANVPW